MPVVGVLELRLLVLREQEMLGNFTEVEVEGLLVVMPRTAPVGLVARAQSSSSTSTDGADH